MVLKSFWKQRLIVFNSVMGKAFPFDIFKASFHKRKNRTFLPVKMPADEKQRIRRFSPSSVCVSFTSQMPLCYSTTGQGLGLSMRVTAGHFHSKLCQSHLQVSHSMF